MVVQLAQGRGAGRDALRWRPAACPPPASAEVIPPDAALSRDSPAGRDALWRNHAPRTCSLRSLAVTLRHPSPVGGQGRLFGRDMATGFTAYSLHGIKSRATIPTGAVSESGGGGDQDTKTSRASTVMGVGVCGGARCTVARTHLASAARGQPPVLQLCVHPHGGAPDTTAAVAAAGPDGRGRWAGGGSVRQGVLRPARPPAGPPLRGPPRGGALCSAGASGFIHTHHPARGVAAAAAAAGLSRFLSAAGPRRVLCRGAGGAAAAVGAPPCVRLARRRRRFHTRARRALLRGRLPPHGCCPPAAAVPRPVSAAPAALWRRVLSRLCHAAWLVSCQCRRRRRARAAVCHPRPCPGHSAGT